MAVAVTELRIRDLNPRPSNQSLEHGTRNSERAMHYLLIYDVVDDYVTRRVPLRAAHIGYAREAIARGELVLGGAFANPPDGAVLLFRGSSPAAAERFAEGDPYVTNGLVTKWRVREWTTVLGPDAEVPLPDTL